MSKRVWAAVLLAMTVVIALVAAIIPMRWHAANARADALADRADEAAADAPPPSYDRPPLDQPGCRREPIEAALFTELADICDDVDWEVRQALLTNARTASGSVGCLEQHGPDLERISTLGCGAFEATSAWGDPAPAYMVPAASAEDEVVHWLVAYASLQSPGRCLELVFRGLRIAQDQAARADSMALRINSVSAPFSHRDVLLECVARASDADARHAAEELERMVAHHPPIDRAAVFGTARFVRDEVEMYRQNLEEESPYWLETPWQVSQIDALGEQWGDLLEGHVPDYRAYPDTLPDARCGSAHEVGPCRIPGDAFWLREARVTSLAAWALAESSPLRFQGSLEALDRDVGVDPTSGGRLEWEPSGDLRLGKIHAPDDVTRSHDVVLTGTRFPEVEGTP